MKAVVKLVGATSATAAAGVALAVSVLGGFSGDAGMAANVVLSGTLDVSAETTCSADVDYPDGIAALPRLDVEQSTNARTIYAQAVAAHVDAQGAVVGIATAMQESGLRNLDYGDRDSLGLFQQRAAWASAIDRTTPATAARMFFLGGEGGQRGLVDVAGWRAMPVTMAAQAVQVSAFPTAYAQWVTLAMNAVQIIAPTAQVQVADCPSLENSPGDWTTPVQRGQYRISSGFGPRLSPGGIGSTNHKGLDFAAPIGTVARAAAQGTVTSTIPEAHSGGFGNLVIVDNGDSITTYYAHLSAISVQVGQRVKPADPIGAVGQTGHATGPHLHFEVRRGGIPLDPDRWLRGHGVTP